MTGNESRNRTIPHVPVSWGELIDKITILEIKIERIRSDGAKQNVEKELGGLRDVAHAALSSDSLLASRKDELKRVNEALWDIEDRIRAKEKAADFDHEFVEIARSVYKRNDERARIKRLINVHMASEIVEEKSYQEY